MSVRFNPVSLFTRRRSKSKTKTRSQSVAASESSSYAPDEESEIEPKITRFPGTKRSLSTSPSVKFRFFASLRRTRSPRRQTVESQVNVEPRPAVPPDEEVVAFVEPKLIIEPVPNSDDPQEPEKSPAPLAQHDCFDITDVSDIETDDGRRKGLSSLERSGENQFIQGQRNIRAADSIDDESERESTTEERSRNTDLSTDEEDTCRLKDSDDQNMTPVLTEDEASVLELPMDYDTAYPDIPESESTLSASESPLRKEWTISEDEMREEANQSVDHVTDESKSESERYVTQLSDETHPEETQVIYSEASVEDEKFIIDEEEEVPSKHVSNSSMEQEEEMEDDQEEVVDIQAPQFEVEHDPSQDPFAEVEYAASRGIWGVKSGEDTLAAPKIFVISASSESLYDEPNKRQDQPQSSKSPPERPQPPEVKSQPSRPPPRPSTAAASKKTPPPRPTTQPLPSESASPERTKKRKLFGIVDVGELFGLRSY